MNKRSVALVAVCLFLAGCNTPVNTMCVSVQRVSASLTLKAAFKSWCSDKSTPECKDLNTFIKTVVENNDNYERACGTPLSPLIASAIAKSSKVHAR